MRRGTSPERHPWEYRITPGPPHLQYSRRFAFTLVELLVVIVIISILISAVMVVSTTLIDRSRTINTQSVLTLVQQAVEEFGREQKAGPTLTRAQGYAQRYGRFPPDELEVFSSTEAFPNGPPQSLAIGGAEIVPEPNPPYTAMKFYTQGLTPEETAQEHRDIAALFLTIELFGQESSAILDRIPDRNWSTGPLDTNDDPTVFLDRNANGKWDAATDLQVRFIVDAWGMPISYLAQRDWTLATAATTVSTNHAKWNEASTELIRLNGNRPVIFSYGPDGKDQLTKENMGSDAALSLVGDFEGLAAGVEKHRIDHPLNADNVYADPALKDKLTQGIPP